MESPNPNPLLQPSVIKGELQFKKNDGSWEKKLFVLYENGAMVCLPRDGVTLREAEGIIRVEHVSYLGKFTQEFFGSGFEMVHEVHLEGQKPFWERYAFITSKVHDAERWMKSLARIRRHLAGHVHIGEGIQSESVAAQARDEAYRQATIECTCFLPSGTSIDIAVQGLDLLRDIRDNVFLACQMDGRSATDYTLKLEVDGVYTYLDTTKESMTEMWNLHSIQRCIDEKKAVVLHLVPALAKETVPSLLDEEPPFHNPRPTSEDYAKFCSPLLSRVYLHIRIIECWFQRICGMGPLVNVVSSLYHGSQRLAEFEVSTAFVTASYNPQWNEVLTYPILLYDLPETASLSFAVYCGDYKEDKISCHLVGWTNYHFMDNEGKIDTGVRYLGLWDQHPYCASGTVPDKLPTGDDAVLAIALDDSVYPLSLKYRSDEMKDDRRRSTQKQAIIESEQSKQATKDDLNIVTRSIESSDVFYSLTDSERQLFWNCRETIKDNAKALPRFLQSVSWHERAMVLEARRMLPKWAPVTPYATLQLLGPQFGDAVVRKYAIQQLDHLTSEELRSFTLQLVQALFYEPQLDSPPLLHFLLERAMGDSTFAHDLFWHLKAGLELPYFSQKLQYALSQFTRKCTAVLGLLKKQEQLIFSLDNVALTVRGCKDRAQGALKLSNMLTNIWHFESVSLPVDISFEVDGLVIADCKYMDSKKAPLWLAFTIKAASDEVVYVMYKTGDDLRQDMLTLQLFSMMNAMWLKRGMDLKMSIYKVITTGKDKGMIKVVTNAETFSHICQSAGGGIAVFNQSILYNWLASHAQSPQQMEVALDNFTRSCAAYSVATCVLGIGDRHNDNVMLKRTGEFFHIDFGHILGHFKEKFGIKRERVRFVLTPDMAYLMGGSHGSRFKQYEELCIEAFNTLRAEAHTLINLVLLMISSGLEEISKPKDIHYMVDCLLLDLSNEEAGKQFKRWIHDSLKAKSTQINNAFHTISRGDASASDSRSSVKSNNLLRSWDSSVRGLRGRIKETFSGNSDY